MEKILLAVNSHQVDANTLHFACYIAKITNSKLTTLLLRKKERELISADSLNTAFYKKVDLAISDKRYISPDGYRELKFVLETCEKDGVKTDVIVKRKCYEDKASPVDQTIKASLFADLLILDPQTSFKDEIGAAPTDFIKAVVSAAQCPIVIAPGSFDRIDDIVFCYDGGRSSVFAMKQFTFLFPQLRKKRVIVLEVNSENEITDEENNKEKISNWLSGYYSNIDFHALEGPPGEKSFKYFLVKKNLFVVMGAYGRSDIPDFFKKSTAELVMHVTNEPLFISHY